MTSTQVEHRSTTAHRPRPSTAPRWDVLHLVEPRTGGAPAVAEQFARWEAADGLRVGVVGHARSPVMQHDDAPFGRIPMDLRLGATSPAAIRSLRRLLPSCRVVHLHSSRAALLGRVANLGPSRPMIFTPHGWSWHVAPTSLQGTLQLVERCLARRLSVLHALSDDEADAARSLLGIPAERVEVIRNGVDLARFRLAPHPGHDPDGAVRVLVIGRLCRQKGQDLLIDALAALRSRRPVRLTIAGDGPDVVELRRRAGRLEPPTRAVFAGAVADPVDLYHDADLVVFPSRWEGQSLALLEAVATGCAVVATATSGTASLPGVVTCEPTVAGLAAAIGPLLDDAEARRGLAAAAARGREVVGEDLVRSRHLDLKRRLLEHA